MKIYYVHILIYFIDIELHYKDRSIIHRVSFKRCNVQKRVWLKPNENEYHEFCEWHNEYNNNDDNSSRRTYGSIHYWKNDFHNPK